MANQFYAPGDDRAAQVDALFGQIAPRYDLINDLQSFGFHRWWKRRVIRLAAVKSGQRALDICCGTGDLTFALARQGAETIGLDFNEPMLRVAEARARTVGSASPSEIRNPHFTRGDAQRLPFPDNHFDAVTMAYGLRNLVHWETGLREMGRVAKPGGRIVVLDFGKPDNAAWRAIYFLYLRWCVPVFGKLFCGNSQAYAYILESLKHFPAQRGIAAEMQKLGFERVQVVNLLGGVMGINYGEKTVR